MAERQLCLMSIQLDKANEATSNANEATAALLAQLDNANKATSKADASTAALLDQLHKANALPSLSGIIVRSETCIFRAL